MKEKDVSGEELCDYLTWAHFNAVPLQGDSDRQASYASLVSDTCPKTFYNSVTQVVQSANKDEGNLVASGFLSVLKNRVDIAIAKSESNADTLPLSFTNYQALNADILLAIASQSLDNVTITESLPASSNLIFEVWADSTVHGYLNDAEFTPAGCTAGQACSAETFVAAIEAKIGYTDLESACADTAVSHPLIE